MRQATALAGCAVLTCLSLACGAHGGSQVIATGPEPVAVQPESLWDPEAAEDPILSYRLRLATEPNNPALHNNLANVYVLRNWMDLAVQSYEKALDLAPGAPIIWNNLGTAHLKMGNTRAALSAFRKAVKADPRYALAWYNIGVIYDEVGDYDKAIEHYLKAASFAPEILEIESNPQVVNNPHLTAVRLRRYLEEEGNLALPLETMPE
jgi:tetratricopeptide (TPR) repeat protein